jgi:septum formation protein
MSRLILASASPRRAVLLRRVGIPFRAVPSHVSESVDSALTPEEQVLSISRRKSEAVARDFEGELVLGVDTVVVVDNEVLGKPSDRGDAARMLKRLSGRRHRVYSGMTLIEAGRDRSCRDVAVTDVLMRPLSEEDISRYLATGESMDKAGAYAAQGVAGMFIESISGCFYNVMGLPLTCFWGLLEDCLGQSPWSWIPRTAPGSGSAGSWSLSACPRKS